MNRRRSILYSVLLAGVLTGVMAVSSFAGTITSVKIRVSSGIEPGEKLPDITYSNDNSDASAGDGDVVISCSSDRYYISDAKWTTSTSRTIDVGDEPEMKVWLEPRDSSGEDNYFKGTYRSSNVNINGGKFVSASKSGDRLIVRLKTRPVKGTFGEPSDAYWKDNARGTAKWSKPDDDGTGSYEVILRRGSNQIHKIETSGTSFNFYPWMTTAGTYSFKVRTIPKSSKEEQYGTKSEWIESDELYVAKEDVSDGSGRNDGSSNNGINGNTQVGWQFISGYWYYYYPDGNYQKAGWLAVGDKWYLFQQDGKMLRGWQNVGGNSFFLADSGDMLTGWIQNGGRWYYLNTTPGSDQGKMLKNCWTVIDGKEYYLTGDGSMAEGWHEAGGNWYYFYPGAGNKAVNTYINTFYVDESGVWRH